MSRFIFLLLVGILTLGSLSGSISGQTYTTFDGHDFTVTVKPVKETIMFGETTYLSFEVKNLSDTKLSFGDGGDYRNNIGRPDSYKVTVVRDDGKPVPQPKVTLWMGGLFGSQIVPVGESYVRKLFLPHWATFESPGNYEITVTKTLSIAAFDVSSDQRRLNFPSKAVTTKSHTKIKIIETDNAKLGDVINDLGTKMLSETDRDNARDDLVLLDFIKDDRTIQYWIKALETYSKSSDWDTLQRYWQTPVILAKYDTPDSMLALDTAMKSKTDDVRLDVADAFRNSKNPRALPMLMSMQNDSYWFVRLRVVQALGQLKTDESTEKLLSILNDGNKEVRSGAEQFLRARNKLPDKLPVFPIASQDCPIRQTIAVKTMQTLGVHDPNKSGSSSVFSSANCAEALDAFSKELVMRRETKDTFGEAWVLYQIGDIYNETRRYQEAHDYYEMALPLFRQLKNDGQREVLDDLVGVSESLKDYPQAIGYMNQELSLARNSAKEAIRNDEWRILDRIATVYFESGDDAKGFEYLMKRLNFEQRQQSDVGEAIALKKLGSAYEEKGKKTEALDYYQKALELDLKIVKDWSSSLFENDIKELREAIARLRE